MNIFYLDKDPVIAAQMSCDKHVVKMIVEYAQLLSTAKRMTDGIKYEAKSKTGRRVQRYRLENPNEEATIYKAVHYHHPSAVWARSSSQHYNWLYSLFTELGREYTHRYKKEHSTIKLLKDILKHPPVNLKDNGWVEPPPAMSHYPQCIVPGDSIQSYKNYYIEAKAYFAKWTSRPTPVWFSEAVE